MRILLSDVHGGYTDSFIAGSHQYWFPPADADGRGGLSRLRESGPPNACELTPERLRDDPPDLLLVQRLEDLTSFERLTGRRAGRELPAIFLEHTPPWTTPSCATRWRPCARTRAASRTWRACRSWTRSTRASPPSSSGCWPRTPPSA